MTEEDAHKRHSVLELTPSGQMHHFAGAKPDCGCADGDDCTCPADDKVRVREGTVFGVRRDSGEWEKLQWS